MRNDRKFIRKLDVQFISRCEICWHRRTCSIVFTSEQVESRRIFREREQPVDVSGCNESIFRFSNPATVAKSFLDGDRDQLLTQARSEPMKQEHKVDSPTNSISELQQHAYAQRLELQDAHHGCVEFRREEVRLQEELVMKEKALRDTQIRKMGEMGERKS